ncbi:hypothetical protein EG329_003620 [Mollisiaceae sp. DMI_Dod_QoI]|nr:hypothetical protein EG329_003620 [Helotiales sp. DMI_Dod_QoI]
MERQHSDVGDPWIQHLRRNNKTTKSWACILCPERRIFASSQALWQHAEMDHQDKMPVADHRALIAFKASFEDECALQRYSKDEAQPRKSNLDVANSCRPKPPAASTTKRPHPHTRATARATNTDDFQRPHVSTKRLYEPEEAPLSRSPVDLDHNPSLKAQGEPLHPRSRKPYQQTRRPQPTSLSPSQSDESYDIILQPETRPISQEQLVAEVKGIYAGLVMVEAKCIEVNSKQASTSPALNNKQWQALIALHRTLLHEHHDFFLASQHPSASPALRRLASKYAMPARMWRHGIHSFLELLRHRLPASLDHMLAFIYLAYSMMALLYETVPAFEDTWIECLGDLGRYRMAIEDDDIRDREVWTGVARHWYAKASDKAPTTGRLYHHLAILARPNALQQLFYYSKSLCVAIPFTSARESILTLFDPVLSVDSTQLRIPPLNWEFVKAHGLLFTNKTMETFGATSKEFLALFDNQIGRVTRKFMEQPLTKSHVLASGPDNAIPSIILQRIGDPNVLPFIHVTLVFMYNMARHPHALKLVQEQFSWDQLAIMLNTLLSAYHLPDRIHAEDFPLPAKDDVRPFPEDFTLRGLLWADNYFPNDWFTYEKIDDEEKYHERASMTDERKERILWLDIRKRLEALEEAPTPSNLADAIADNITSPTNLCTPSSEPGPLSLGRLWRRAMRRLQRHKKSLARMYLLSQMKGVVAMSLDPSSTNGGSSVWSTVVFATALGSVLAGVMAFPGWRDPELLLFPTIVVDIGCYVFGTDSRNSRSDVAVAWLFAAGLNVALLKDQLKKYRRTGGIMALIIATLGTITAIGLSCGLSFPEGERYSDPLISVAMGVLPGTLVWEVVWLALAQLQFYENLENGIYDEAISNFCSRIFETWIVHITTRVAVNLIERIMGPGAGIPVLEELGAHPFGPRGEQPRIVTMPQPNRRDQFAAPRNTDYRL